MTADWDGKERRESFQCNFSDINSKLTNIEITLAMLGTTAEANHKTYRAEHETIMALIKRHDSTLYGNGSIGLTAKVNELKDVAHDLRAINGKINFAAGVAITVSTLIGLAIKLIQG